MMSVDLQQLRKQPISSCRIAASMDRQQQTEQINNVANIGFYDMQQLLLQGYYFDENPKSQVISLSETAGVAGGKWRLSPNWQVEDYNNGCRRELGSTGEEIFRRRSMDTGTAAHEYVPAHELGGDTGINIAESNINSQDCLGLISTEISSKDRDFLSSGNGASVSSGIIHLVNLHGKQSSAGAQQFDNIACRNPNMPSAAHECWEICHNKAGRNYIANGTSCSLNQQDVLTLPNSYQTSLDFPSSYQRLEGVSLNHRHNINTPGAQQMWQSSENLSLDQGSYSLSGYSSVGMLRSSQYLRAAQQLLEEVCSVKTTSYHQISRSMKRLPAQYYSTSDDPLQEMKAGSSMCRKQQESMRRSTGEERLELQMKKTRLISMVEELDRAYQRYQEQLQLIMTSFESATGMDSAAPYTALAKKLISRQFRALRDAIGKHIHDACKMLGEDISSVAILNKGETPRLRILDRRLRHHRTLQQVNMVPQVWRPQRGLPERSIAVLRAWLFEHFLHPYPTDSEKLMLSRLAGLTKNQVANWFINARVRLWKPMVEEMYAEEKKEAESQNEAGAEQQDEQTSITECGSRGGSKGNINVTALARRENPPKRHRYEHLVHEECNRRTSHHSAIMTKHGVSLTLALQHSSSDELEPNIHKPNQHYFLHPGSGDADCSITDVFSRNT